MKKLYTVKDCEPCNDLKKWIKQQPDPFELEIVELVKLENEWHEKTDDGFIKFDKSVISFPALMIGKQEERNVYVIGKEGVQSVLEKGYLYEKKLCPFLNKDCIEKKCAKFVVMTKGPVLEGNCSDYWTSILLTELLTKGN